MCEILNDDNEYLWKLLQGCLRGFKITKESGANGYGMSNYDISYTHSTTIPIYKTLF